MWQCALQAMGFKNMVGYRLLEKFHELIFYYYYYFLFGFMVFESMDLVVMGQFPLRKNSNPIDSEENNNN